MLDVGCIADLFKCAINWVVPIILAAVIIQLGISLTRETPYHNFELLYMMTFHMICDLHTF